MTVLCVDFSVKPVKESTFVEVSTLSRFNFQQLTDRVNNEFYDEGNPVLMLKIVEEMKKRVWAQAL